LAIDPNGNLWDVEMGPRGGDEINLIQPGKNYGWGDVTYGIEYSGDKVGQGITQKKVLNSRFIIGILPFLPVELHFIREIWMNGKEISSSDA
jgi:glucose/arabinose dehydrogenase